MDKCALRREMAEKKRLLSAAQIESASLHLAEKLFDCPEYHGAAAVYAYLSFNQEVRTRPVILRAWADGKRVAVPKIADGAMRFVWIEDFDHLRPGAFGIPEPEVDGSVADDPRALVLVPGLAFDRRGHRVGYGGGYYDRFLADEREHPLIALCYDFQLRDHLDAESHDIPVHRVLWEKP